MTMRSSGLVRMAVLLLVSLVLQACVTEDVGPHRPKKTKQDAVEAYVQLGMGYLQEGSSEQAKEPLSKALELDPKNADAHTALAVVFQSQGEPQLADQHYRAALSERPKDARILNNYGTFLYQQGRYQEAYQRFQLASADGLYAERARVFQNLGLSAQKLNQPNLAKEYFQRSLRLDPRQPQALLEMAKIHYDAKEYVPARAFYQGYRDLVGQSVDAPGLLLGIRLATIFQDQVTASRYAQQLETLYPTSQEYRTYRSGKR